MVQERQKEIESAAVTKVIEDDFQSHYYLKSFYWIGLENLHLLTSTSKPVTLRIFLQDISKNKYWAQYDVFKVGNKSHNHTLEVDGYSGNAGDGLSRFNGLPFITFSLDTSLCFGWWAPQLDSTFQCIFNNLNLRHEALWEGLTVIHSSMVINFREP